MVPDGCARLHRPQKHFTSVQTGADPTRAPKPWSPLFTPLRQSSRGRSSSRPLRHPRCCELSSCSPCTLFSGRPQSAAGRPTIALSIVPLSGPGRPWGDLDRLCSSAYRDVLIHHPTRPDWPSHVATSTSSTQNTLNESARAKKTTEPAADRHPMPAVAGWEGNMWQQPSALP